MLVLADFVPRPKAAQQPLVVGPDTVTCGHVRLLSQLRPSALDAGEMVDRGIHSCPCEIDVELSKLLERAGPSYAFEFFFEPQGDFETTLDVELHRSLNGRLWHAERLLADCHPGIVRSAPIRTLLEQQLRLRMRFRSKMTGAVRIWMREPHRGNQLRKIEELARRA
jgi:hypothetical protein